MSATAAPTPADAASGPDDPLIGRTINDRYRILEAIGQGGMGRVYKALQAPLDRVVAIKVLAAGSDRDGGFQKRFFLEASVTARLTDPHTITLFDYGRTDDGIFYIAMEYLTGRTLAEVLRTEGPLAMDRVIHIAQQICRSLREAHGLGIIHRDLKPANVILRRQQDDLDFVKVLDFGLVKFFSGQSPGVEITHAGTFMGSPHYIAPEQARNQSPDQRCDIYSLGVLLFHMATGRVPFTAASPVDIILKHLHDPPQPPRELRPDFPQGFEAVILRCLEKDRAARYQSMDELLLALKQARAELGLPAGALSAPPSAGLAASRPGSGPGSGALLAAQVTPAAMATPSASQRLAGPGAGSDAPSITVTRSRPHRAPLEVPTFSSLTERPPLLRPVTLVALGLACSVAVVGYRTGRALLSPPAVPSPQAAIAGPALPAVQPEGGPAPLAPGRLSQGATTPSEVPTALANTTLVTVVSTPAGAAVHDVEDRLLGATPFELRVPSNQPLQLILRAQGFRPGLVRQQTVAGERLTLSVALKREAKQPPSAPPPGRGRTGSYKEDPY